MKGPTERLLVERVLGHVFETLLAGAFDSSTMLHSSRSRVFAVTQDTRESWHSNFTGSTTSKLQSPSDPEPQMIFPP